MNNPKKGLYNFIYSLLGQIITVIFGFLLPKLFVVNYGSEVNGLINSLTQFFAYLNLLELGLRSTAVQSLYRPIAQQDKAEINTILAAAAEQYKKTATTYLICTLGLALLYPLIVKTEISYWVIFGVALFMGLGNVLLFWVQGKYTILLRAEGKRYILSNIHTLVYVAGSLVKVIGIMLNLNIVAITVGSFFVTFFQIAYVTWYIKKHYAWVDLAVPPKVNAIRHKTFAMVQHLSTMVFHNVDILLLTLFADLRVISVYSLYKLLVSRFRNLLNDVAESVLFMLGQKYQTDKQKFTLWTDIYQTYYNAVVFAVFAVILGVFIPFMKLYMGSVEDINYIEPMYAWFFVVIELMLSIRQPMVNSIEQAGMFREAFSGVLIEIILKVLISAIAIFRLGVYGVLIGSVVSLVYRLNNLSIFVNRKVMGRSAKRTYVMLLANFITFFLTQWMYDWLNLPMGNYLQIFVACIILGMLTLGMFLLVNSALFWRQTAHVLRFLRIRVFSKKKSEA